MRTALDPSQLAQARSYGHEHLRCIANATNAPAITPATNAPAIAPATNTPADTASADATAPRAAARCSTPQYPLAFPRPGAKFSLWVCLICESNKKHFPSQWRFDWAGFPYDMKTKVPLELPTVAALAARGVHFTQAYVPAPVCAPSRSCLASARDFDDQVASAGVPTNSHDYNVSVPTFYHQLREAGYWTMTTGKDDLTKVRQGYKGTHSHALAHTHSHTLAHTLSRSLLRSFLRPLNAPRALSLDRGPSLRTKAARTVSMGTGFTTRRSSDGPTADALQASRGCFNTGPIRTVCMATTCATRLSTLRMVRR
jgi:hypothetical protein